MLLNFFTNLAESNSPGRTDVTILSQLIMTDKHDMKAYDYRHTTIRKCDIAIHLDFINPIGLNRAKINILITSLVSKIDILNNYLSKVDFVFTKTQEAYEHFAKLKSQYGYKLKHLGWTTFDKLNNAEFKPKTTKQFYTFIHNQTDVESLMRLIEAWPVMKPLRIYSSLTKTPDNSKTILDLITHSNVDYIDSGKINKDSESAREQDSIYIHLEKEPFDYIILYEASAGNVLISPNDELVSRSRNQWNYKNPAELIQAIKDADNLKDISKASQGARDIFIDNQRDFLTNFTKFFLKIFQSVETETEPPNPVEQVKTNANTDANTNGLKSRPLVSIITPTYNRQDLFKKVALYNWEHLSYPNREWIIVDDSPEPMDWISQEVDKRITYIYCGPEHQTIGAKRNLAIQRARGDIIMCMDDDDYYPVDTIENRLALFAENPWIQCSFASTIACYNIYRKFSYINTPSVYDPPHKRVSEATLIFRREFWLERGFPVEPALGEGEGFIEGRYDKCLEVDWRGAIISLIHNTNVSNKMEPFDTEPNGNHFMNDEWGMTQEFAKLLEERL